MKKLLLLFSFCSASVYAQTYNMSNTSFSACSGVYRDPGGTGPYADNSNFTQSISSTGGNCVQLSFSSFDVENAFDNVYIYDGPSVASPQVPGSPFTGTTSPGVITSTGGWLTIRFTSDNTVIAQGWEATISCVTCPPPPPPPAPIDYSYGWSQRASVPAIGRHRGIAIAVGNRGYAGMGHINAIVDIQYDDWWEYDPGTNSWTQKASFPPGTRMHPTAFAIGNYAYVGTGRNASFTSVSDFWRYDPATNTWAVIASMPTSGRRGAVAFSVNGKGYVGTGSYTADFWEYNPVSNTWTAKAPYPGGGRTAAVAFAIGNKGYVGTGDSGGPNGDFYEYDPATNVWTPKATLAGLPRMEAAAFELNGKGYIGTGCDYQSGNNYKDFWRYDPALNQWQQIVDFSGAARRYMNAFTIGDRAYGVFGTSGTNYNDLWQYGNLSDIDENMQTVALNVYPNPFSERITLSVPASVELRQAILSVYDIYGKLILQRKNITEKEIILEKSGLPNGIYFYELQINDQAKATGKLIAQ